MTVKSGRDAKLEAEAKKWLTASAGDNKRSLERDLEKIQYEKGWIALEDLQHYDPTNDWDTHESAYSLITDAEDIDYVDSTADAENVVHRNDELAKRRQLMEPADDSEALTDDDKDIPLLGDYDVQRKVCTRCNLAKRREYFSADKRKKDGLQSQCKKCHQEVTAQNRSNARSGD